MLIPKTKVTDPKFPLTNNSEFDLHKENQNKTNTHEKDYSNFCYNFISSNF